jgi:hypothetical protein
MSFGGGKIVGRKSNTSQSTKHLRHQNEGMTRELKRLISQSGEPFGLVYPIKCTFTLSLFVCTSTQLFGHCAKNGQVNIYIEF